MIYPKKNLLFKAVVDLYVSFIVRRHFYATKFNQIDLSSERSILLIANHFSFWDGLILYQLNKMLFKKNIYTMMLEETSKKEPMLKYAGAFTINKGTKDIITSLNYAAGLLNDPQNLVLIFPQGKLFSNFVNMITFEKGIMKILKQAAGKFNLVFAATFTESFRQKKDTAFIYLKNQGEQNFTTVEALNKAYQQHYDEAKTKQTVIFV